MKSMKRVKVGIVAISALAIATTVATSSIAAAHDNQPDGLGAVRKATAQYRDLSAATAAQYGLFKDAAGIACIDNPGVGAMGVHYVNGGLVGAGVVDPVKPQALVYEPAENGKLHLVAVEYVVFQAGWDASHTAPPSLFGTQFMLTPAGNRFGLPAYYSLHAWVWKTNPLGVFNMWNPRVHCTQGDSNEHEGMDMSSHD